MNQVAAKPSSPARKPPASKAAPLPDGTVVGRYRIVRTISRGGFSVVYLAQGESGAPVAIKEYLPQTLSSRAPGEVIPHITPEGQRAYRIGLNAIFEEGRVLVAINHPQIVRVLDFFRANETVYMVMPYESGRSLQDHVIENRNKERRDVLSEGFIRRVFALLMEGLHEVHSRRLLHLDIKPANIYLQMDGSPILLDFGAARQTLERDAKLAHPMYTPGFAAPEAYNRDAQLGPWTDVYSVGATLFACMAGRPPTESPKRRPQDDMPAAIRALKDAYSAPLVSLVDSCLRLNSLERPQNVNVVRTELLRVQELTRTSFFGRTADKYRAVRGHIETFVRKHDITWF